MIDVARPARHAAVVQQDRRPVRRAVLEPMRDRLLAAPARRPSRLVRRRAADRQQQPADQRMAAPDPRFAIAPAARVLARGARARRAAVELQRLLPRRLCESPARSAVHAVHTVHASSSTLVVRFLRRVRLIDYSDQSI
jgi:hypothetical protein